MATPTPSIEAEVHSTEGRSLLHSARRVALSGILTARSAVKDLDGLTTQTKNAKTLAAVTRRAEKLDAAERKFTAAVAAASEAGASLRAIAAASGWTHERIRQLLKRGGVG